MRRVTIRDVGAAAGVSRQTVSRVLNDRPDVAPQTRQRVLDVIERLGYQPSNIARSLIQGRSCTLGVVSYGIEYFGPSRTLSGIEHQANELGYTLLLSLVRQPGRSGIELLRHMLSHQVDGIIWAVPAIGNNRDWTLTAIPGPPVPVVFLDMPPQPRLSVIATDGRHGGRIATTHLLDQGYQKIGLITGPLDWWSARQRELGYRDALEAVGLAIDDSLVVAGTWSAASGERGMNQLLEQHPGIDAVFACNDQMALGVLKVAREAGRRVPQDMGVVGFDDIPEAAYFCPSLSTMRQDLDELGRSAVRELGCMIEASQQGQETPGGKSVLLQSQLIVRGSSVSEES